MAKIHAGPRELNASQKRLASAAKQTAGTPAHLLRFYAAECGLKYLYLHWNNFRSTEALDTLDHDLVSLIKSLKLSAATIAAPPTLRFRGKGESCSHTSAHQAWRYGVHLDPEDEQKFVVWLEDICDYVAQENL
jgi:hypothetical protein